MAKVAVLHTLDDLPGRFMFFCPGCRCGHWFQVGAGDGPRWTFDGNMEAPTVHPSILTWGDDWRCHSFVTGGLIRFLDDCTHALKGQTVPLESF